VSLETPEKSRTLQRKLYTKAKKEPEFRLYLRYDTVHREDILHHSYRLARQNGGAPGVDGTTFAKIESAGFEEWIEGLRNELREKAYRPSPVKRVMIPKPGGGERPLGIPTIRDRGVQTAVKIVLEPIFGADFEDCAYGYRPKRSAQDAVKEVHPVSLRLWIEIVCSDAADLRQFRRSMLHWEPNTLRPLCKSRRSEERLAGPVRGTSVPLPKSHLGPDAHARGTSEGLAMSPVAVDWENPACLRG
jgi:RNA-directed DNA polymerase